MLVNYLSGIVQWCTDSLTSGVNGSAWIGWLVSWWRRRSTRVTVSRVRPRRPTTCTRTAICSSAAETCAPTRRHSTSLSSASVVASSPSSPPPANPKRLSMHINTISSRANRDDGGNKTSGDVGIARSSDLGVAATQNTAIQWFGSFHAPDADYDLDCSQKLYAWPVHERRVSHSWAFLGFSADFYVIFHPGGWDGRWCFRRWVCVFV